MTDTQAAIRYILVRTDRPAQLDSYLYSHTLKLGNPVRNDKGAIIGFVLMTTADTDERVGYLAQYQVDRLNSGNHGAKVFYTLADVHETIREWEGQ